MELNMLNRLREVSSVGKSLWIISVTAACWSVWLVRNELVFDRKWPTMNSFIFHSKIRALMWVRFWCPSRHVG
ncbi:hypothetical protein Golax_025084 [Gossypium laxum]|uniref:Uncharacterized protein n=1 Tax=Gossypium laxum TaxID=34288 RepID=A0A7J8ZE56_9ROSI|nr:hypothetical protein [Gossypium laxum]